MRNPARIGHFRCKSLLKSSGADATFAVDHMDVNFDEQAVAYVRSNSSGQSRGEVTEMMRYYGYTEEQINNAFEKAGF